MEEVFTKKEAAEKLRISRRTLEARMQQRRIDYFRDGSRVYFAESHLETYRQSTLVANRPMQLVRRRA